ncbi:uncharacterized protein LOC142231226 [Haematobia irritans]|uniref:uncharacterized protein LOC142231226 n=1 Tax=Haematobia irritans TaxID=7368 RepID=UPI003F4FC5E3
MSSLEKFEEVCEELARCEARLKEENFLEYTAEAIECERNELDMLWAKFKSSYEGLEIDAKEKKKVYAKHTFGYKSYIKCVNIIAKIKRPRSAAKEVAQKDVCVSVPPCDTGVFRGDYASWPTFRDLFTAIYINNSRLGDVEKLFYLFQKTDGEAREVNRNVTLTAENFDIAWGNLKAQYENKRVLINSQLRLLFNMAPCAHDSAQEVKRLQRDVNNCMAVLKLFDVDIASWDPIFVFLCSARLSEQTLNLWGQYHALESVSDIISTNGMWSGSVNDGSPKNHRTKVRHSKSHHTKVEVAHCKMCKEAHAISSCKRFLALGQKDRAAVLKKFKYCFNCLKTGHIFHSCPSTVRCAKCQKKHNTLLHRDVKDNSEQQDNVTSLAVDAVSQKPSVSNSTQSTTNQIFTVQAHHTSVAKEVMLATAWVNIMTDYSTFKVRALIDPCSDESFISERIQKLLKLPTIPVTAEIAGLGGSVVSKSRKMANFNVSSGFDDKVVLRVEALVVPQITGNVPTHQMHVNVPLDLPQLPFADPEFYRSKQVDILLGGDLYPSILRSGVRHGIFDTLVAQETIFGWIVTGPTAKRESRVDVRVSHFTKVTLDEQLTRFWELEEVPKRAVLSEDDIKCEEIYCSSTVRRSDGRYVVNLPFRIGAPRLGPNRYIAVQQFLRNEKRLLKTGCKGAYDDVINEYGILGHMKEVSQFDSGPSYYLPHHGVVRPESTTTKLRVVFNASSPTSTGVSLNDILYTGPVLQKDLVALVVKWRFYEFVFNADISKMYRQICINPEHSRYQRIVFRECGSEEIRDYELNTVTFGVNCAPYLALRTLLRLAQDEEVRYPTGAQILRSSMYVDDAMVGAHSVSEAIIARDELVGILKSAGFELRKWTANSKHILKDIPSDHLLHCEFLCLDDKSTAKTLGVRWNAVNDFFFFVTDKVAPKQSYTKREVLSTISRLFDPAGWLAPVIVAAKIIMQDMWLDKVDWDDNIQSVALQKWQKFISTYHELDMISIPRWIGFSPECEIEYHGFCDSSESAYAATLYARISDNGSIRSNLLVAKTKVAPIRKPSLPRLELCGASLLADLVDSLLTQFEPKNYSLHLWSDSTIVLAWLRKPPCSWKTFVANRVASILEKVGNTQWAHVSTNQNPADLATRGIPPSELKNNRLWWHGPEWLSQDKSQWPISPANFETKEEARCAQVFVARSDAEDILDRFSSFTRALHVISYMFRFYLNSRRKGCTKTQTESIRISSSELAFVRRRLFLLSQRRYFDIEYKCLQTNHSLPSDSPLLTLTPFLDDQSQWSSGFCQLSFIP